MVPRWKSLTPGLGSGRNTGSMSLIGFTGWTKRVPERWEEPAWDLRLRAGRWKCTAAALQWRARKAREASLASDCRQSQRKGGRKMNRMTRREAVGTLITGSVAVAL